jgi:RNA polymerase sigma factor (sigma-70 family)
MPPLRVPPTDQSVEELSDAVSGGDPAGQTQHEYVTWLFTKYRGALQRYLLRFVPADDAAELVQETYYRLLRHGETVQLEAMARAFLYQTATNLARDHRRRALVRHTDQHEPLGDQDFATTQLDPEECLFGDQVLAIAERVISELPQETRMVFMLSRYRGMSYPQIAEVLHLSSRTVARKMTEALDRLSTAMAAAL